MSRARTLALAASIALAGCVPTKIVGRYASATCDGVTCGKSAAVVSVSSTAQDKASKPATFKDMPERAMAAYVHALSDPAMSKSATDLRQNLAGAIKGPAKDQALDDRTAMARSMAITVAKTRFNPSDRLVFTQVKLTIDNGEFADWTTAKTEYETFDLGSLKSEQSLTNELGGDANTGGGGAVLPTVTFKTTAASTRNEELAVKQRAEILTPEFSPTEITLTRQGVMGIDLTGNTLIDLTVTPPQDKVVYVTRFSITAFKEKDVWLSAEKIVLKPVRTAEPRGVQAITGKATLTYVVRHITKGDDTLEERDDKVEFTTTTNPAVPVVLVPARETSIKAWGLSAADGPFDQFPLYAGYSAGRAAPLCFDSFEEADDLLDYLRATNATKLGTAPIGFMAPGAGGAPTFSTLPAKGVPTLQVSTCLPGN